jgi:hypothetical protein
MVLSYAITVATNGEHMMCSGFSLSETIRLGSFEFIANYFGRLSLSPVRGKSDTAFMDSTCSGTPSPWQAMIKDFNEEFIMVSSRKGGSGLPSPKRRDMGAHSTPVTTTPWMENALATQATMTVPPWTVVPQLDTGLPFEQCHTH